MLISVVIPVYNGEYCLAGAVESILPQMSGDVELVIVNDGSTDGSGMICDEYAQKYDHIRVIHKDNGGISSARNAGISAATGEYLTFLDSDDYLDRDALDKIRVVIRSYHPDLIDFGWKYVSRSGETTENQHKIPKDVLLDRDTVHRDILPPLLNLCHDPDRFIYDFSCTKVFRRDIIEQNQIAFDENRRIWEDRPFVVHYLRFCHNFYSIGRCFYNYVDMPGSLSRRYSMDFFRIIVENFQMYRRLYGAEYDFDTEYVNNHWSRAIENMIFRSLEQKENREQIWRNVLATLENNQVVHWFSNRQPENHFEKEMSRLVSTGQCEEALNICQKRAAQKRKKQFINALTCRIKHAAHRLIGR